MKRFPRPGLALFVLVCLLLSAVSLPVLAQGSTVLAVDPAQATVEVNGEREIRLYVTDADNLNAFDVQVEYDGDLLSLIRWEFGDLLSNLAVVKRDDLPGSFRLVATQLATPGVSGDGVLLKLIFSGKVQGSSAITITRAEFARSEGGLSLPELQNGVMTIVPAQPTATPTRTPTATATQAATATATATATQPPSATPTVTKTATSIATATTAATLAATTTRAATSTVAGPGATPAPTGLGAATSQPTPVPTQAEATRSTEAAAVLPGVEEQGGTSGTSGGNGYLLKKSPAEVRVNMDLVMFIVGLLIIGSAVVVYFSRKARV